ncbi:MAG: RIP metalloprotease RseP [Acidobacteriota bacterium]
MFLSLVAFVFVLGVLVFIHELGHFLTAKWIGVKVHVFSLGFPPKLIGRRWGETEYRIGLVPLGGYVKMAGDNPADASGNLEEFFSRTKLERVAILAMGPVMNLALAVGILTVLFMVGIERPAGLEDPPVVRFVPQGSPAAQAGIRAGDRLVAVDDRPLENWRQALDLFVIHANQTLRLTLERDGQSLATDLKVEARGQEEMGYVGLFPAVQPEVVSLSEGFPAQEAGLQEGDLIIKLDGEPVFSNPQLIEAIQRKDGRAVTVTILRQGRQHDYVITPTRDNDSYRLGITLPSPVVIQQIANPFEALGAAVAECARFSQLTFVTLGRMIRGLASIRQMSGPISIARISGETARRGPRSLFYFMAVVSLSLGILNFLPIPILDGGHIAIIFVEGLARRDFSLRVKERILQVGLVLILLLMVTVIYIDLSKIESIGRFLPW